MSEDLLDLAKRLRRMADEAEMLAQEFTGLERARRRKRSRHPDLEIDVEAGDCAWRSRRVTGLSRTHLVIVEYLSRYPDWIRSREDILTVVDPTAERVNDERAIDSHIRRIRGRFLALDPHFDQIETVTGFGYRWRRSA